MIEVNKINFVKDLLTTNYQKSDFECFHWPFNPPFFSLIEEGAALAQAPTKYY